MSELIPVNIIIADRSYRLRIQAADEETVRKTAQLINEKITEYKTQFSGKDMQDYVAMVLLWFATEKIPAGTEAVKWKEMSEQLANLEKLVDKALE